MCAGMVRVSVWRRLVREGTVVMDVDVGVVFHMRAGRRSLTGGVAGVIGSESKSEMLGCGVGGGRHLDYPQEGEGRVCNWFGGKENGVFFVAGGLSGDDVSLYLCWAGLLAWAVGWY